MDNGTETRGVQAAPATNPDIYEGLKKRDQTSATNWRSRPLGTGASIVGPIGAVLYKIRESCNLTQHQVESLTKSAWGSYERGELMPKSAHVLIELVLALRAATPDAAHIPNTVEKTVRNAYHNQCRTLGVTAAEVRRLCRGGTVSVSTDRVRKLAHRRNRNSGVLKPMSGDASSVKSKGKPRKKVKTHRVAGSGTSLEARLKKIPRTRFGSLAHVPGFLYTRREVARRLGIAATSVPKRHRWIPPLDVRGPGGQMLYLLEDVDKFIERSNTEPGFPPIRASGDPRKGPERTPRTATAAAKREAAAGVVATTVVDHTARAIGDIARAAASAAEKPTAKATVISAEQRLQLTALAMRGASVRVTMEQLAARAVGQLHSEEAPKTVEELIIWRKAIRDGVHHGVDLAFAVLGYDDDTVKRLQAELEREKGAQ